MSDRTSEAGAPRDPVGVLGPAGRGHSLQTLVAAAIIVAGLYFARGVLIPVALAVLLTFLIAPLVTRLRRAGLGRVPAVLAVAIAAFALIGLAAWGVSRQLIDLAASLPQYEQNIRGKLQGLDAPGGGLFERTSEMVEHLREDLAQEPDTAVDPSRPIPVEIREPEATTLDLLRDAVGSLAGPATTAGVVIVLVIFMLIQREDLRDRFLGVVGAGRLHLTTEALDDAGRRISRYLQMQLIINISYGVPVGLGLYVIGVPNPLLWGILATVLRFVPYVGPLIGMVLPLTIAFAVDPGWTTVLLTLALLLALELFSNNVMEPWLYGASTGISAVGIMVAAIFWTWIWGPIGLLLSTPLTVCLVVVGRHVPQMRFLSTMLGTEEALSVSARVYQRLLASDVEEAAEIAEEADGEAGLAALYDEVLVPALSMLEDDRHHAALSEPRLRTALAHARDVVEELAERQTVGSPDDTPPPARPARVALLPARDQADEIAGLMLERLLARRGATARLLSATQLLGERLAEIASEHTELVCVCAVPPSALTHAAYTCKRLRRQHPTLPVVVGLFSERADVQRLRSKLPSELADEIVTSLHDATERIAQRLAARAPTEAYTPAPVPVDEQERLAELTSLGLLDTPPEEAFDRVTRDLAKIFGAPISLLSLIDSDRQYWKSQFGLPAALAEAGASDRETSMCGHVVGDNDVLVVDDTDADPRFAGNPFLQRCGIRFYAGAPLRTRAGHAIGSLCVIDTRPRQITARERELLKMIADAVMTEVELRASTRGLSERSQQLADANRSLQQELDEAAQQPRSPAP